MSSLRPELQLLVALLSDEQLSHRQRADLVAAEIENLNALLWKADEAFTKLIEQINVLMSAVNSSTEAMNKAVTDLQDLHHYTKGLEFEIHCLRNE